MLDRRRSTRFRAGTGAFNALQRRRLRPRHQLCERQIDDAIAAGEDATRPPARRELGRRAARRAIVQASRTVQQILALAERALDEPR